MDLNLEQKQNLLEALHNKTINDLQMYASGLTTLTELAMSIGNSERVFSQRIESMEGLLCPNTGLRFPLTDHSL
jgi:hypothetical protein